MRIVPAAAGRGLQFHRTDQPAAPLTPALLEQVSSTQRRTVLGHGRSSVATVEHFLAAVYAAEIDDLTVEVDGPELPILDGSFAPFMALLQEAGERRRPGATRGLLLDRGFAVSDGESSYQVEPAAALSLRAVIQYAEPVIGRQSAELEVGADSFAQECAGARTFGFEAEMESLRAGGLVAGATMDSAILCSPTAVLNTTLRWPNEFARHKLGDLLGDLALLGVRPRVRILAERPSHRGNLTCMRALARAGRIVEDG